ncbi:MAG: hypothetical protein GY765_15670 [bacterium]|nr:hypothetical protein [bacterium]
MGTLADGLLRISTKNDSLLPGLKELGKRKILSIAQGAGSVIWLGTESGLFSYDAGRVTAHTEGLPSTSIYRVVVDKNGHVRVATPGCVYYWNGNRFQALEIPLKTKNDWNIVLMEDSTGTLWIGTPEGLVCCRDSAFTVYTTNEGLEDNHVSALCEDFNGRVWIGTINGLNVISEDTITSITTKNGLVHNFIYSLMQDREGNMWVAAHGGVSCVKSIDIATYTKRDGLTHNLVYDVIQDKKGRYWIGTQDGLNCFNGREIKTYTMQDGLPHNAVLSLLEDRKGKIWIGTLKGLSYFASNKCVPYPQLTMSILTMSQIRDGSIYVGTADELFRLQNGVLSPLPFKGSFPYAACILEDRRGNLWIAYDSGIFKYSQKGDSIYNVRNGKLRSNRIFTLFENGNGSIWVGCKAGLSRYHRGDFVHYSTADGLPDNSCFSIQEAPRGTLWIGTGNGLVRFDGHVFTAYTSRRHGFPSDDWAKTIKDNSSILWLGSPGGLTRLSPPIKRNRIPPPIYITGFKVAAENELNQLPLDSLHIASNLPEFPIRLEYQENYIEIRYEGLCFSSPESVVYRYRLEGMAQRETQSASVSFANLAPGSYRFEVTAKNNDGIESREPAAVEFEILPPFWGTWWFRLLVIVAVAAFSSFLVIQRYKRVGEKSEMEAKNRQLIMAQRMELVGGLAAGTVHDLKNMLSIILSYTRLMSRKPDRSRDDHHYLGTIKNTAATAVQMTKQILSLTRSPSDSEENTDLGKLLEEILDTLEVTLPQKIETCWVLPEDPIHLGINPARFQQVMLNLCWNAVHAMPDGGKLTISLACTESAGILLQVSDTGTGIEKDILDNIFEPLFTTKAADKGTGLGLFVVKRIVMSYNGTIEVHSETGKGTTFNIRFKVPGNPAKNNGG